MKESGNPGAALAAAVVHTPIDNPPADQNAVNAAPNLGRFLALALQLALLQAVFIIYDTIGPSDFLREKTDFPRLSALGFGAFLVHYWLPFRFKEVFWVAVSIAGAFVLLDPRVAELLIGVGVVFFLILRSGLAYKWRVALLAVIFAALAYGCAHKVSHIPERFYAIFGAIFMFRIIVYVYDLAHLDERPRLLTFLSYFFILPNYLFTFFPVIDYQTMRETYYQRDIHEIAQQGVHWMTRGAIQLMIYRMLVFLNDTYLPDRVSSFADLAATISITYLLYLNVSGQFHIIVGMLHLFGYDLPETNHRYLLASSLIDLWRRINIYWKDFMVKMVYFPVYFRLRKKGDLRAQVIATAAVFIATWLLHSYQFFWIRGQFEFTWTAAVFWCTLGSLVVLNVLWDEWRKRKGRAAHKPGPLVHALQVLGTFAIVSTLWSLWSTPTLGSWVYLMTHWIRGNQ